jgi:hypothetical protein
MNFFFVLILTCITASITIEAHGPFLCHPPNHYCSKNGSSSPAAAQNRFARREHAAHRPPLVARERAVRRQEVVASLLRRSGRPTFHACLRECKEWLVLLTWKCRHERHMLSSRICQLQWEVLWGFLFRMVYACRRWRVARPKDLLATARPNRLVLILAGLNALRGVATRRPNRACYPRVLFSGYIRQVRC